MRFGAQKNRLILCKYKPIPYVTNTRDFQGEQEVRIPPEKITSGDGRLRNFGSDPLEKQLDPLAPTVSPGRSANIPWK